MGKYIKYIFIALLFLLIGFSIGYYLKQDYKIRYATIGAEVDNINYISDSLCIKELYALKAKDPYFNQFSNCLISSVKNNIIECQCFGLYK